MSYRPFGQFAQYLLPDGQVNAGGFMYTYENDLTTPKLTYSDPALTIPNPVKLPLTAEGYLQTDVWGDGIFGAELADGDDVVYRTFNNIQPDTPAFAFPALVDGAFLTNDGSNLLWQIITQFLLPDPTGLNNRIPISDGTAWTTTPFEIDVPDPEIVISPTNKSFRAGVSTDTSKFFLLVGSDTFPANPGNGTSVKAVTYADTFTVTWGAFAIPVGATNPAGPPVIYLQSAAGLSSATFVCDIAEGNTSSPNFGVAQPFTYVVFGTKTV